MVAHAVDAAAHSDMAGCREHHKNGSGAGQLRSNLPVGRAPDRHVPGEGYGCVLDRSPFQPSDTTFMDSEKASAPKATDYERSCVKAQATGIRD